MKKVQKSIQSYSTIYVGYSLYNNLFILGGGGGEDEGASGGKTKKGGTAVKVCWKCRSHYTRRLSPIQAELATQTMLGFLVNVGFFIDL